MADDAETTPQIPEPGESLPAAAENVDTPAVEDSVDTKLKALEEENRRLKAEQEAPKTGRRGGLTHGLLVAATVILIVLGCVAIDLANVDLWIHSEIFNTDTFVAHVGPLPKDPAVAQTVANKVVTQAIAQANLETVIKDALPAQAGFIAAPLVATIQRYATEAATSLIQSDQFSTVWVDAVRLLHQDTMKLLRGGGPVVTVKDGVATLDLNQLAIQINDRLKTRGINLFPSGAPRRDLGQITIVSSSQLGAAQDIVKRLDRWRWLMPLLTVLCLGGAIAISPNRRRAILGIGVGFVVVAVITAVAFRVTRNTLVGGVSDPTAQTAVLDIWKIFLQRLWQQTAVMLVVGLIVAVTAYLVGPARGASWVRKETEAVLAGLRGAGVEEHTPSAIAGFVGPHKRLLEGLAVALAFVVLLIWPHPTVAVVILIAVILLILVLLIELFGGVSRGTPAPASAGEVAVALPPGASAATLTPPIGPAELPATPPDAETSSPEKTEE